jgi:hypothetical protein
MLKVLPAIDKLGVELTVKFGYVPLTVTFVPLDILTI